MRNYQYQRILAAFFSKTSSLALVQSEVSRHRVATLSGSIRLGFPNSVNSPCTEHVINSMCVWFVPQYFKRGIFERSANFLAVFLWPPSDFLQASCAHITSQNIELTFVLFGLVFKNERSHFFPEEEHFLITLERGVRTVGPQLVYQHRSLSGHLTATSGYGIPDAAILLGFDAVMFSLVQYKYMAFRRFMLLVANLRNEFECASCLSDGVSRVLSGPDLQAGLETGISH